jgi:hypothetical protein
MGINGIKCISTALMQITWIKMSKLKIQKKDIESNNDDLIGTHQMWVTN